VAARDAGQAIGDRIELPPSVLAEKCNQRPAVATCTREAHVERGPGLEDARTGELVSQAFVPLLG
jgi:hypothetical protein